MRIAVLGAGKMGAWLAVQLASEHEVAVYDPDASRAESVRAAGTLRRIEELQVFAPNLLVNAASLVQTLPAFQAAVKGGSFTNKSLSTLLALGGASYYLYNEVAFLALGKVNSNWKVSNIIQHHIFTLARIRDIKWCNHWAYKRSGAG